MKILSRTIAIVDDHYFFRETASRFLQSFGFEVLLEASNGMEFLRLLESGSRLPDACLLDMEMPVMDGLATANSLRERFPSIRVVAFTLSRDQARKERIIKAGAVAVLSKTLEPMELKDTLLALLSGDEPPK